MGFMTMGRGLPNFMNASFGDDVIGRDANASAAMPVQSPEEAALLAEQTRLLKQQQEALTRQMGMQDLLFADLGFTQGADGKWTRTGAGADIEKLMQERTLRALRGELPVDAAFEKDRAGARGTLGEVMMRNLGTGWETSTPGMEALSEFDSESDALRQQIREGMLTNNEALINNRQNRTFGSVVNPTLVNSGGTLATAFGNPVSSMLTRSGQGVQTNVANLNAATQRLGHSLDYIQKLHTGNMSAIFG